MKRFSCFFPSNNRIPKLPTFLLSLLLCMSSVKAQSSSDIYKQLQKLNFLGSVLYLAAHPDDENTRVISYFSNHVLARTAYLSMTRGDGGQNLIGAELREALGLIRTQELLTARKIDGGSQFFTIMILDIPKIQKDLSIWDENRFWLKPLPESKIQTRYHHQPFQQWKLRQEPRPSYRIGHDR